MKRGDAARETVRKTIIEAFGENYVATIDKKIYVNVEDGHGGELLQFAITMTMPKTPVATNDWSGPNIVEDKTSSAEISQVDKDKVAELMQLLGF